MTRRKDLEQWLDGAGCNVAEMRMIAGDASNRKYFRSTPNGKSIVIMDAPPEKGEDIQPFVAIAQWLRAQGLSAPEIVSQDTGHGFLMLEDLGDDLFARVLEKSPRQESEFYHAAADVLLRIQSAPPPVLGVYSADVMAELSALSLDWYRAKICGDQDTTLRSEFTTKIISALRPLEADPRVLIQRDYHAENLLWLPARQGVARVGLLDFQDAMIGHPAYDLVSVLQDARRDVTPDVSREVFRYFTDRTRHIGDFSKAYYLLGLQRNLRILGVFVRLCVRDGKRGYLDLIPRVWGHIQTCLENLSGTSLVELVSESLPPPTPDALNSLRKLRG